MRERMLEAIDVATKLSIALENMATDLAVSASKMDNPPVAAVLRAFARQNRVEAIKVDAQLAVLRAQYGELYGDDCP